MKNLFFIFLVESIDFLIDNKEYDMDDIILTFCEVWIKHIKNGELLNVDSFSSVLLTPFLTEVSNLILNEKIDYLEMFHTSKDKLINLFKDYIILKNNGNSELNDLINNSHINKYIITIFDNIYEKFDFSDEEISRNKIYSFFQILISSGLKERLNKNFVDEHIYEEEIINNKFYSDFNIAVKETLSDYHMGIINKRFGFDGEAKTLEEVASTYGVTKENIRQIEAKALKKLRRTRSIIQFSK